MSGSIRIAKAAHRGDPGILGFLGGVAKGAITGLLTGGPAGAFVGGAAGAVGHFAKPQAQINVASNGKPLNPNLFPVINRALPTLTAGAFLGAGAGGPPVRTAPSNGGIPGPVEWMKNQGVRFPGQSTGGCGAGYHTNKTGYHTAGGYVAAGTKCVRNRRRNPLNPRAASRAMSRLTSAKKASRFLNKIHFGGAPAKRVQMIGSGKKGCGCK